MCEPHLVCVVLGIKPRALCMLGCINPRLPFLPHLVSQLMLIRGLACASHGTTGTVLRWSCLASLLSVLCNTILFPQLRHGSPNPQISLPNDCPVEYTLEYPSGVPQSLWSHPSCHYRIYALAAHGLLTLPPAFHVSRSQRCLSQPAWPTTVNINMCLEGFSPLFPSAAGGWL